MKRKQPTSVARLLPGEHDGLDESASTAVLCRQRKRSAERLTVLYDEPAMQVGLGCGKDVVLSGTWELEVRRDGKVLDPKSDWENVCWTSDDDADYLELEIDLRGGVRVQRSMLLAREDRFLLVADAVLGNRSGAIEYCGRLPLGPSISFDGAEQSHEGTLSGSRPRAKVLPLALPEWKTDKQLGELVQTRHGLELRQSQQGRRLFAPLFFDLDRRRHHRAMTWRRLTVVESLEIQPTDVVAGYRVAIGRQQWLIYRSLAERANRTLLGHNISSEMLVARFNSSGEVSPLVEIE